MGLEMTAVVLAAVLPLCPCLFAIHRRIGRFGGVMGEFRGVRDGHDKRKVACHEH